jgi:hypothetical protein
MPPSISRPIQPFRPVSSGVSRPGQFRGAHTDRQQRNDLRAAKRWGGLDLFAIPTPLLWLENGCVPNLLEPEVCAEQPIADLWP